MPDDQPAGRDSRALAFAVLALLAFAVLAGFSLFRHATYNSGAFDLGIFDQVVWNSARGRLFANTLSESPNFLGQHFSPVLLALAPVSWLGGDARALIVIQAALLVAAAIPVFLYARTRIAGWPALLVPILLLAHPTLMATATFDFHEVAFAPVLISLAVYGALTASRLLFLAGTLPLFLVREDLGLVVAGFGLWVAWQRRWRVLGLVLAVSGVVAAAIIVLLVIPAFRESGGYFYLTRYGELGSSPGEIVQNVVTNPGAALGTILASRKFIFLAQLAISFALLPLLAPATLLLAVPNLAYLFAGQYRPLTELLAHYPVTVLPPLAFAAVDGQIRLQSWLAARGSLLRRAAPAVLLVAALVFSLPQEATLLANRINNGLANDPRHLELAGTMLQIIPPLATVSAQTGLAPHLSERQGIWLFPVLGQAEYIAVDTRGQRYAVGSMTYEQGLDELVCDHTFGAIFDDDGLMLFQKGAAPEPFPSAVPVGAQRVNITFPGLTLEAVSIAKPVIARDELPHLVLYWRAGQRLTTNWTVFVHLVDKSGKVWAQYDAPPLCGDAPFTSFEPGRLVRDDYWPLVQRGIPAGDYRVLVGLYDPSDGDRPLANGTAEAIDIGGVRVEGR